jgi:caffeoyl-CoA O-methyltransferase
MIDREAYINQFTSAQNELLLAIENYTQQHHPKAHMLSGHYQGRLLSMLSKMLCPTSILEVGTFTGFSSLCLAEGLPIDGSLHTIELREEDAATAQDFFNKSAYKKQITLHVGNAKEIINILPFNWDLAFIDADKTGYIEYYELILPKLNKGGIILADNVLFHNEVLQEPVTGKNALAVHAFNQHIANDNRTEQIMLGIRDGLSLIRKL